MYQVLLADDESAVTDALCQSIDWASLDLNVAAVVRSGKQAMHILQTTSIDLVITDIRMYDMDGLTLAQAISQLPKDIPVILISGFAEFAYAQKALLYGVMAYCVKPLDYTEIRQHLRRAVERLKAEAHESSAEDFLELLYASKTEELRRYLAQHSLPDVPYHLAVSVSRHPLSFPNSHCLTVSLGHRVFGYISSAPFPLPQVEAQWASARCSGFSCSPMPSTVDQLCSKLMRLNNLAYRFFFDPASKITADDQAQDADDKALLQDFFEAVDSRDIPRILHELDLLAKTAIQIRSLYTAWHLYRKLLSVDMYDALIVSEALYSPEHLVYRFGSFQNMIGECTEQLRQDPIPQGNGISNTVLLAMLKSINDHQYNCSLKELAQELNMNANYLGLVFKEEMGKPFTAYITELKIAKAKELIDTGNLSISEISTQLGFNDYFYFLKTFKRITSMTPTQYRQRDPLHQLDKRTEI